MSLKTYILTTLLLSAPYFTASAQFPDASLLFTRMLHAMETVSSCSFRLKVTEWYGGKEHTNIHKVKMQVHPFKAYIYCIDPNAGAEALYVNGSNNNKVLINPNKFPYFNVSLGSNNMILRKEHPFSLTQLGFSYILPLLKAYIAREGLPFFKLLSCNNDIEFNGKKYYLLEINNTEFGFTEYKVKKGETVVDIAEKLLINDKMIRIHNPSLKDYGEVKEGAILKVPNSFARKIEFYVDKESMLPMVQVIYDDKGLYTRIEFSSFVINPVFKPEEFTSTYPDYNF